ncbi:MAG TPA: NAD-dependent epimerase/dehydratase family protein [Streptosporangiaceae bacterium]|jgi:UDP-glucose 4-epimerase|nr:NAD-dependent epimerase/dehydratase family protein [Streptosporangiaceae bacterium]
MRVIVTGGAGFIGSHLTDAFLARGDDVTVIDDLSAGRPARLDERVAMRKLSVTDARLLSEAIGSAHPDLICHLAAQIDVRASVARPAADAQTNVIGTINVLEAAKVAGSRVLLCSTGGALYGRDAPIPSMEDVLPLPESPYGIGKYCAEQYLGLYNRLHDTAHSVLRLANVYGPRQDPTGEAGVVAIFCSQMLASARPTIFGDGSQTRDYVYVGDVVSAFLAAADQRRPGTWNIGTGAEVSVLDLMRVVAEVTGRPADCTLAPARAGELQRSALAIDRARLDLGWKATTGLEDGVRAVCDWIRAGTPDRAAF